MGKKSMRPLRRLIQKNIKDRLALMLFNGEIRSVDTVSVDWDAKARERAFSQDQTVTMEN